MKNFRSKLLQQMLKAGFKKEEALCEIDFLIQIISGKAKKDFYLNPLLKITDEEKKLIYNIVKRRLDENMPVQYLVNK
ncbi:MAG: hypothetical protein WC197_07855, partial [Candidatus Gastranaerophilaceae bacterium]